MSYGFYAAFGHPSISGIFPIKLGGGGQSTIFDYPTAASSPLIGTDVGGALKYNGTQWNQIITTTGMPITDADPTTGLFLNGVWGLAQAPSDPTRVYMLYGAFVNSGSYMPAYLFVSNDSGATFTRAAGQTGSPPISCDPNDNVNSPSAKFTGPKMAVDPNNKDICFFGVQSTSGGTTSTSWATFNGGATLVDLSARGIPNATAGSPGYSTLGWAFDGSSNIWCASPGNGIYKSTNGGTTFSLITGSPTTVIWGAVSKANGQYWATQKDFTKIWRVTGTTCEDVTNANTIIANGNAYAVVPYPADATKVALVSNSGSMVLSVNATAASSVVVFDGTSGFNYPTVPNGDNPMDVPWFGVGGFWESTFFSVGQATADPVTSGKIWINTGIGVANTLASTTYLNYHSVSAGLSELINTDVCSPPGYKPLMTMWDRPLFRVTDPNTYPSQYYPNYPSSAAAPAEPVTGGWACEWAAQGSSYQVAHCNGLNNNNNDTCFSNDGGVTWTSYRLASGKTFPSVAFEGGCIAAQSPSNVVVIFFSKGDMYYTKDGGANWINSLSSTFLSSTGGASGMQNAGTGITPGWGDARGNVGKRVTPDRVTADTFYCYNSQSSSLGGGFYNSTNKGDTWNRMISGPLGNQTNNEILRAVPNLAGSLSVAGNFFYTDGRHGTGMWLSQSGTTTASFISVNGVKECYSYNFGAVKPGNNYPSVYMIGFVGSSASSGYGLYRSDNSKADWAAAATPGQITWNRLTTAPLNSVDVMNMICGDSDVWGKWYAGGGNQHFYGTP